MNGHVCFHTKDDDGTCEVHVVVWMLGGYVDESIIFTGQKALQLISKLSAFLRDAEESVK